MAERVRTLKGVVGALVLFVLVMGGYLSRRVYRHGSRRDWSRRRFPAHACPSAAGLDAALDHSRRHREDDLRPVLHPLRRDHVLQLREPRRAAGRSQAPHSWGRRAADPRAAAHFRNLSGAGDGVGEPVDDALDGADLLSRRPGPGHRSDLVRHLRRGGDRDQPDHASHRAQCVRFEDHHPGYRNAHHLRGVIPFVAMDIVRALLLLAIPALALAIPRSM
jgi:hypothetical protein